MEKAVVEFNSGQLDRYTHDVAPLERRLNKNSRVNWAICLMILLLTAVAGVVIGFLLLPALLGMFAGLLGGSIVGLVLIITYYFVRSSAIIKTKKRAETELSSCEEAYLKAYKIPTEAIQCYILASDFLPRKYFARSLIYTRDDGSISIVAPDYRNERNEIRYSTKTVIAYSLCFDSRVLVQSEEGIVLFSSEAKNVFMHSDLPLLNINSNLRVELADTSVRAFVRPNDLIQAHDTKENLTWNVAIGPLSSRLEKEGE